ncbi:MAG: hypothetical protein R3E32_22960 [Chitinophagales bacterium]
MSGIETRRLGNCAFEVAESITHKRDFEHLRSAFFKVNYLAACLTPYPI